ncbi:MAG: bifunctional riboflavin kinase/FAD synthetase [Alphaproteobacteria bacterium]|nr:bifunctional riboflavin kinase/FAD synthetase [Alphaproteobacteria bacterium]
MRIVSRHTDLPSTCRGAVVAIGNFDGVHLGHRHVIGEAARRAAEIGAPLGVMTFEPHPRSFFNPEGEPFRLTSFETKARRLEALGVDVLYALPFDAALAGKDASDFIMDVLVTGIAVLHVVVGEGFRFGRARSGDTGVLGYSGEMEGFGLTVVPPFEVEAEGGRRVLSSSVIRRLIAAGRMEEAARFLGAPFVVDGRVAAGHRRGRTIGFPTANLPLADYQHPAFGVYAVEVEHGAGEPRRLLPGVANVGVRPTVNGGPEPVVEAHLFEVDEDLYGHSLAVRLLHFLRPERKFDGLDALKAQIARDADAARAWLSDRDNHPQTDEKG